MDFWNNFLTYFFLHRLQPSISFPGLITYLSYLQHEATLLDKEVWYGESINYGGQQAHFQ